MTWTRIIFPCLKMMTSCPCLGCNLQQHWISFRGLIPGGLQGLVPTWWPPNSAPAAPAPPASRTDTETVPPLSERKHGSAPGMEVGFGSPTRTGSWGGRSRGGLENWNCPLARSVHLHNLTRQDEDRLHVSYTKTTAPANNVGVSEDMFLSHLRVSDTGTLVGCGVTVLPCWLLLDGIVGKICDSPSAAPSVSGGLVDKTWSSTAWPFISAPGRAHEGNMKQRRTFIIVI